MGCAFFKLPPNSTRLTHQPTNPHTQTHNPTPPHHNHPFFFKPKTAYEITDGYRNLDVCISALFVEAAMGLRRLVESNSHGIVDASDA
eukprot:COSAG02_NODE_42281_length_386_cov_0.522648_1_plen_87_part_01